MIRNFSWPCGRIVTLAVIAGLIVSYTLFVPHSTVNNDQREWNVQMNISDILPKQTLSWEQRSRLLSTKGKADWQQGKAPKLLKHIDSTQVTMFSAKHTTVNVLSAGHCHIRNLYLFQGTFYIVTDTSNETTDIFGYEFRTGDCFPVASVDVKVITYAQFPYMFSQKSAQWQETTVLSFQWNNIEYLAHYFHFVEQLVSTWLVYMAAVDSGTTSASVKRAVFPRATDDIIRGSNRHISKGINMQLLRGTFGNITTLNDSAWRQESQSEVIQIESAIIVGHAIAYFGDEHVARSNKMTLGICHVLWNSLYIDALKKRIFDSLHLNDTSNKDDPPFLLYIDRQWTLRHFSDKTHQRLLEELGKLKSEGWAVRAQRMEELTFAEQVALASRTDVIVGVHGNGLTHALWAPKNGGIIEIQPPGQRHFDYEWIAQLNSLKYASVDISGVEWMGRHKWITGSMMDKNITVDIELVGKIIRSWKHGPHESNWRLSHVF